ERAVPAGLADLVDVRRAQALLHARRALPRWRLLAEEVRHELHHAGVDEQQVRVVDGGQRGARHDGVPVRLEMLQEPALDLRGSHRPSSPSGSPNSSSTTPSANAAWIWSSRSAIASRTSSTKLRTESTTPPALFRAEAAMPVGVNACAFFDNARNTRAPTARPTPSQRTRFIGYPRSGVPSGGP